MSLIPSGKSCKYIILYGIEYHHLIDYILHAGLKIYVVIIECNLTATIQDFVTGYIRNIAPSTTFVRGI